jgi:hypothetical protein
MLNKLFTPLLLATLTIFFVSCKKDASSGLPDSYVKIKKNGVWKTYSDAAGELGPDLLDGSKTDFVVTGYTADQSENLSLSVQINGSNFVTGNYASDSYPNPFLDINFTTLTNGSELHHFGVENGLVNEDSKYTMQVTEITDTHLSGSFSGNYLYDSFASDSGIVRITEGEFRVKRIR